MNNTSQTTFDKRLSAALANLKTLTVPLIELFYGVKTRTLPWEWCASAFVAVTALLIRRIDVWVFRKAHLAALYPRSLYAYWPYFFFLASSGFLVWAGLQTGRRRRLVRQLGEAFQCAGLKNKMGRVPGFISDRPLDQQTRLQVYVDDIRECRERGTIDITYSHLPMPDVVDLGDVKRIGGMCFAIGHTRTKLIKANLEQVPHLLVAGQTSSGKSTFLRQLIVSTYLNNRDFTFTLADLKEGLEFQIFENLPRVRVVSNLADASAALSKFNRILVARMQLLKLNAAKDLAAYLKIPPADRKTAPIGAAEGESFGRHLIIIDEAADLFLAGGGVAPDQIQAARRNLVELARKGRAVGLHLVFATQRPDARSIDAQVKANLPGILCFQMPNDASSMTVLGSGRATDLPPIAGRAIWKCGSETLEVQTPYLSPEKADDLLKDFRTQTPNKDDTAARPNADTAASDAKESHERVSYNGVEHAES